MSRRSLPLLGATALALFATTTVLATASTPPGCGAHALRARMAVIAGSAGAGSISYALTLRNASRAACVLSGRPGLRLRGLRGQSLPTRVNVSGAATAVLVRLAPGASARTTLRFSPDVPGPGEQHPGACEPVAYSVSVSLPSPGHGSLVAQITPPTSVCEHGAMVEANLAHA